MDALDYFCKEIYPLVCREVPDNTFYVVGADPPPRIRELGQRNKRTVVTGFVEDLREYYNLASVAIAPMRFVTGMQNKILQAMAMGLPVVATSVANEGINATPNEEIFIADDPTSFARTVVRSLNSPEDCQTVGKRARRFVHEHLSWTRVAARVAEIEEQLRRRNGD